MDEYGWRLRLSWFMDEYDHFLWLCFEFPVNNKFLFILLDGFLCFFPHSPHDSQNCAFSCSPVHALRVIAKYPK
jgi:hypothetical protein